MHTELIPAEPQIYSWIEEVFSHGVRRPGYDADRWAEAWIARQFRAFGLERVRTEPVELPYWEPQRGALTVEAGGAALDLDCFPLPHTADADGIEAPLAVYDASAPERVRGAIALCDTPLMRTPQLLMRALATSVYDPDATFDRTTHILPFSNLFQDVTRPAVDAGAAAFIGVLSGYPGDSRDYYVPYDGEYRPLPAAWVRGSDGARIAGMMRAGDARARLSVTSRREPITSYNIIAELPGADDETVIIGSHHDGPWASAVEDASGIALVLAQASYWSRVPREERPHRLVFLLNAGHMAGGAGARAYCAGHQAELARVVLEVHLEHTAREFGDGGGVLAPTGEPETRWWFTSRNPALESHVRGAIEAEDLRRSMIMPPDAFGPRPTTDGGEFHLHGVPLVNFLTAPFYLFDAMDTLDKIDRPSLAPVTRAAVRIIGSTAGVSAAAMRAGVVAK